MRLTRAFARTTATFVPIDSLDRQTGTIRTPWQQGENERSWPGRGLQRTNVSRSAPHLRFQCPPTVAQRAVLDSMTLYRGGVAPVRPGSVSARSALTRINSTRSITDEESVVRIHQPNCAIYGASSLTLRDRCPLVQLLRKDGVRYATPLKVSQESKLLF
jgi:hypothetical protein